MSLVIPVVSASGAKSTVTVPDPTVTAAPATAAERYGWGTPVWSDDFASLASTKWSVYDSAGHAGNGRRTPAAVKVANSILTITADAQGNSGGLASRFGQLRGRWEVRMRCSAGSVNYHPVLLLWPMDGSGTVDSPGGEIDFVEITDSASRQSVNFFLHPPEAVSTGQLYGNTKVDATQWHNWAFEWTATKMTAYVDGNPWYTTTRNSWFPTVRMGLCIQLDNMGGNVSAGGNMQVDWVRTYT